MTIRLASAIRMVALGLGLFVILGNAMLMAQEGERNVVPAGQLVTQPSSPVAAPAVPTTSSGRKMQAFGKKNKGSKNKSDSTELFSILPPRPGASAAEKKKWYERNKSAPVQEPKVQPKQMKKAAPSSKRAPKPTSVTPQSNPAAAPVTPTSLSGRPMVAFGKKNKSSNRKSASSPELLSTLPPGPGASAEEKKKWFERNKTAPAAEPKTQPVQKKKKKKAAPLSRGAPKSTSVAPDSVPAVAPVTPTSLSGLPMLAFGSKKKALVKAPLSQAQPYV